MGDQGGLYTLLRRGLFRMDAERVHHLVMGAMARSLGTKSARAALRRRLAVEDDRLRQTLWGVEFANPLGLAAGFDKDGKYFNPLSALGFGHVEIGTVTGLSQEGNPRPRLFRLAEDQALLNRMGFNNGGSEALRERLEGVTPECVLGINFGKSKVVPLEEAAEDYALSLRRVHEFADYLVVNVSSPNTPGLRKLQGVEHLMALLGTLQGLNRELGEEAGRGARPLLLKIAPDLSDGALSDVIQVVREQEIDGIIATNTTVSREDLAGDVEPLGAGGVSGRPLTARSRSMVAQIFRETGGEVPIVGVGGVFTAEDALLMIRAGASLVQIWTGFIYQGPLVVQEILKGLQAALDESGVDRIGDLVGVDSHPIAEGATI